MTIATCVNEKCSENGIPKDASALDPLPPVINCGQCSERCEITQQE